MILTEIGNWNQITNITNLKPFVYWSYVGKHTTADYWINVFDAPDETNTEIKYVEGFQDGVFSKYSNQSSLADCVSNESSYYFDADNQILYYHLTHTSDPYSGEYTYQTFYGFSDKDTIYIDDQEFMPLIKNVPNLRQSQDLFNYSKPNYINGSIALNNVGGYLDFMNNLNLYGNNCFVSYIDQDDISYHTVSELSGRFVTESGIPFITESGDRLFAEKSVSINSQKYATRTDINRLIAFFIDDFDIGINEAIFRTLDVRSSGEVEICTDTFELSGYPHLDEELIGKTKPLVIGSVSEYELTPINTNDQFKSQIKYFAQSPDIEMNDYGTAYILIDGVWTEVTPTLTSGGIVEIDNYVTQENSCVVSDDGFGNCRITKTGKFANVKLNYDISVAFAATYKGGSYKILNIDDDYIDIGLDYSAATTADLRIYDGALELSGSVRKCKLVNCEGIQNSTGLIEALKFLNEQYLNIDYNSSYYDTIEFAAEGARLSEIGVVFSEKTLLSDAIHEIQNKANVGFRYEANSDAKFTLIIDDEERALSGIIYQPNIINFYDSSVTTDRDLVYSKTLVNYSKSFITDNALSVLNNDNEIRVINDYKKRNTNTVDSYLTNETDATERALFDSTRLAVIPKIVELTIACETKADRELYFNMRIFDIWKTALSFRNYDIENGIVIDENIDSGLLLNAVSESEINFVTEDGNNLIFERTVAQNSSRDFLGIVYLKIISTDPRPNENKMIITGKILPEYEE